MTSIGATDVVGDRLTRIASPYGGRRLQQFVVAGDGEALLVDAGDLPTAQGYTLPALDQLGVTARELLLIVVTHTDVDHQGGVSILRDAYPDALLACGFEDVALIEDPELMLSARYNPYGQAHELPFPVDLLAAVRDATGPPLNVDIPLLGGEVLSVGGRAVRVHHGPGHSAGHLMIEDPQSGDLIMGDAVHGRHSSRLDGGPAIPPTYEDVDAYLATIAAVRKIAPQRLHSGHEPTLTGDALDAFLTDSVQFVNDLEELIEQRLATPATLVELCQHAQDRFGPYDTPPFNFVFAVHGHVRRMLRRGAIACLDPQSRPVTYSR
jgi:glyoxylase-like metal-dependent hydrolase (beta-lactamase superfamily II)